MTCLSNIDEMCTQQQQYCCFDGSQQDCRWIYKCIQITLFISLKQELKKLKKPSKHHLRKFKTKTPEDQRYIFVTINVRINARLQLCIGGKSYLRQCCVDSLRILFQLIAQVFISSGSVCFRSFVLSTLTYCNLQVWL